jgi:hypothetical protein
MEVDGKKRFKLDGSALATQQREPKESLRIKDVANIPYDQAQHEFRKMTVMTHYSTFFGSKPKEAQDFEILKHKKFSKLPIATVLKPNVVNTVERWLGINDQDEFTRRVYATVRDIYTAVKG